MKISVRVTEYIRRADLGELLRVAILSDKLKKTADRRARRVRPQCGAKTRKGTPCTAKVYWPVIWPEPSRRCRLHGGLSTGPKTPEGKDKLAETMKKTMSRVWAERREGSRPMPQRKTHPTLEEELSALTPEEIRAVAEAFQELVREGLAPIGR